MLRDLFDRAQIGGRLDGVAAGRARQQHAEQPCLVQPRQQRFDDALGSFDVVGGGRQLGGECLRTGHRIGAGGLVHPGEVAPEAGRLATFGVKPDP